MSESEEGGVAQQRKHSGEATREEIKAEPVMTRLVGTFVCVWFTCLFSVLSSAMERSVVKQQC